MTLYPHEPPAFLDDGLFVVVGRWKKSPFERKMTIFLLSTGELAVHSAIAMDAAGMTALESLGRPSWILVPNRFHASDAGWYADRYPSARVLVPAEIRQRLFEKLPRIDGSLDEDWPEALAGELAVVPLRGTRIGEVAFVHAPSRTLVLTDACFHYKHGDLPRIARLVMRMNGAYGGFGTTRFFRSFAVNDRDALRTSIDAVLEHEFARIVVSHGRTLEYGGPEALREAFAKI
ncbi:MAG TPA: hypothetical protein VFV19_01785 [Candidatus Polarisedimenticolaceae bacterium]|nr:hypothetical protein [Candidatus Polarisedimenticolaceae bacterium]